MKYFLSIMLLLCTFPSAAPCAESGFYHEEPSFFPYMGTFSDSFDTAWSFQIHGGYAAGKFIGLKENYGEFGSFIASEPLANFQPFGDFKAYLLDDGHWASSLGLGLRWPGPWGIWGTNLYYDYRKGHFGNFNRLGVGFELFSDCLDYRLNLYFPFNSKQSQHTASTQDSHLIYREFEFVFTGGDFEIGAPLWQWDCLELEGALGPYYYHKNEGKRLYHVKDHVVKRSKEEKSIFGGQARLGLNWSRYLTVEARVSCDNVFKTNVQGKIILSLPLSDLICGKHSDANRFVQPVQRNGVIFTKRHEGWDRI